MKWLRSRKRTDHTAEPPNPQAWVNGLPHGAAIMVRENGVQIGKIWAGDVVGIPSHGILDVLLSEPEFGPGRYTLCAYYDGAIRGRHIRVMVGYRNEWRRGSTRVEAEAVVKREQMTPMDRTLHDVGLFVRVVNGG